MHLLVNSLYSRARTALGGWGNGCKRTGPAGNDNGGESVLIASDAALQESGGNAPVPELPVHEDMPDIGIPVRICPHCGYEIRTWINGDLSCTRCENDIRPGEGMISSPDFQVRGICDVGSRL